MLERKRVAILGSTGSVGTQAVDVILKHPELYEIVLLSAEHSTSLLAEQAELFRPKVCVIGNIQKKSELESLLYGLNIKIYSGEEALCAAIEELKPDIVVNSISGIAALAPAIAAASAGSRLAMANKEAIVVAGPLLEKALQEQHAEMIPVDSEHSAIFQCIDGRKQSEISRILLTASGGPFRGKNKEALKKITPSEALAHPTWKMGVKVTVDSATLMNKGFEIIEAVRLFHTAPKDIEVLIHPQSIIHSMVEYIDNAIIAQLGTPDMHTCISYAMSYPKRIPLGNQKIDFFSLGSLTFEKPDTASFPLLEAARYAIELDGLYPTVLNAADEIAVEAFLQEKIGFTDISKVVLSMLENITQIKEPTLDEIYACDAEIRRKTLETIRRL